MVGEIRAADKADVAHERSTARAESVEPGVIGWVRAHPLVVVAAGAALIALVHAVWIWSHRHLGGYDPDESGYIASSLRIGRTIGSLDPLGFVRTVGSTGNGVTVPLLSAPLVVLGPEDPRTAMMVQPILLIVTSVGVAGITRRMAGPFAAIGAGLLFATLPTVSTATQSYWYGLGAAMFLVLAMWALLASDRGSNGRIWWFGACVGLMCLSRTMSLGYVPAAAGAGLVMAGWHRTRLLRVGAALGLGALIAAPWYLWNRSSIFGYLVSYGYGPRAARFGSGGVLERLGFRIERYEAGFGPTVFVLLWASALCVGLLVAWQRRHDHEVRDRLRRTVFDGEGRSRSALAVAAAALAGTAALVSTSNNGVWFELPLVPLITALLVAVIAAGPWWYSLGLAVALAVPSAASVAAHWWWTPYDDGRPTAHYEHGFAQYDPRFAPDRRPEHELASRQWRSTYEDVLSRIQPEEPGADDPVITVSGNMQLFNTNSLTLVGELSGWSPRLEVPDTAEAADRRAEHLTPVADYDGHDVERILLVVRHDNTLFTPDADVEDFARQADDAGWTVVDRVPLPAGGEVQVLAHDDPN